MAQFSFASALKVEVLITTQRQQSVNISKEKQQKRANLWRQMYFIHELKYLKRSDRVTDYVMSLFWSLNKL